jgi:hypothetical protein
VRITTKKAHAATNSRKTPHAQISPAALRAVKRRGPLIAANSLNPVKDQP